MSVQAFDAVRVHDLLRDYGRHNAARVRMRIAPGPLTYAGRVDMTLDIPLRSRPLQVSTGRRVVIAEISVPLPVSSLEQTSRGPVIAENVSAVSRGREMKVHQEESWGRLVISVDRRRLRGLDSVRLSLTTSSVMNLAGGQGPFKTWRFGVELRIPSAERVITVFEHSPELSLRCRRDDSEYHSLAQSADVDLVRKLGFHPSADLSVLYLFGDHAASSFRAVAFPAFAASLGLLSAGYTAALLKAGHGDLAAVSLALALVPPVIQTIKPGKSFYRSADIHVRGLDFWVQSFVISAYFVGVLMLLIGITYLPALTSLAQALSYYLGVATGLTGIAIVTAVQQQIIPTHLCDVCVRRIVWRRRSRLHMASRRTVCKECFHQIAASSGITG
ncbi:hypothetical protein HEK131_13190 [Streptomyces seoulensis]|nr:hypothetical protein HEK131_13190 [Streptomyces seoulensis]